MISLIVQQNLLKNILTLIPLMIMKVPTQNSDVLKMVFFLHLMIFFTFPDFHAITFNYVNKCFLQFVPFFVIRLLKLVNICLAIFVSLRVG